MHSNYYHWNLDIDLVLEEGSTQNVFKQEVRVFNIERESGQRWNVVPMSRLKGVLCHPLNNGVEFVEVWNHFFEAFKCFPRLQWGWKSVAPVQSFNHSMFNHSMFNHWMFVIFLFESSPVQIMKIVRSHARFSNISLEFMLFSMIKCQQW